MQSAKHAADLITRGTGRDPSQWTEQDFQAFQAKKDEVTRQEASRVFPGGVE